MAILTILVLLGTILVVAFRTIKAALEAASALLDLVKRISDLL